MQINYWFRKSTKNPELGNLQAVIKIDGVESKPFSTGIDCEKKNWNHDHKCFEGKGSAQKEKALHNFEQRMRMILTTLEAENPNQFIHPSKMIELHRNDKASRKKPQEIFTMPDAIRFYNDLRKELNKAGQLDDETLENDTKYANNVLKFLREKNRITKAAVDFDLSVMDEFIHYMKVLGRKPYYINRHIMWIKSVHKQAYKRNKISFKPVEDMDLLKVKQELPKVLEPWEVDKVYEYKFKKSLQEVADAWVFCQETSFSYADYISLRDEFLNVDDEGIYWIIFPRDKVEENNYMTPLSARALEIIDKYGGSLEGLPKRSNQTMNASLKEIAKYAGVNSKLHFHMARKSYVHNALNYKGMRDVTIAQTVGWSDTKMLKVYARINRVSIVREFFKKE